MNIETATSLTPFVDKAYANVLADFEQTAAIAGTALYEEYVEKENKRWLVRFGLRKPKAWNKEEAIAYAKAYADDRMFTDYHYLWMARQRVDRITTIKETFNNLSTLAQESKIHISEDDLLFIIDWASPFKVTS